MYTSLQNLFYTKLIYSATNFYWQNIAGKYVGNRPIKLRKSTWKDRIDYEALEKQKVDCHPSNSFFLFSLVLFVVYSHFQFYLMIFRLRLRRNLNCQRKVSSTNDASPWFHGSLNTGNDLVSQRKVCCCLGTGRGVLFAYVTRSTRLKIINISCLIKSLTSTVLQLFIYFCLVQV